MEKIYKNRINIEIEGEGSRIFIFAPSEEDSERMSIVDPRALEAPDLHWIL